LNEDAKLHSTQIDEAKSQHVILNNRLAQIQKELADVSHDLLATQDERKKLLETLAEIERELDIERRAVEEFELGEQRLDGVAHVYKGALGDAKGDLAGLFAKKGASVRAALTHDRADLPALC
jgi:septal ring factor EnvC (AmiA/AmiB activator)